MGLSCGFYEGQTLARAGFGGSSAMVAHAGPSSAASTDSDHIRCFHLISFDRTWAVFYARTWQPDSFGRVLVPLFSRSGLPGLLQGTLRGCGGSSFLSFRGDGGVSGSERLIALLRQGALFLLFFSQLLCFFLLFMDMGP